MRAFLVAALAVHAFGLLWGGAMVRALAATGLLTFAAFAYGIYSWEEAGIHALAPANYRYLQLFYYTGVVLLAWATSALLARVDAQGRSRQPLRVALGLGVAAVVLAPFHISARHVGPRVESEDGLISRVTCALDAAAADHGGAISVHSSTYSSRVIRLFRGPWSEPSVEWRLAGLDEFLALSPDRAPFALFDHRRMQLAARYKEGEVAEEYQRALVALDTRLWEEYEPLTGRERGTFYRRSPDGGDAGVTALRWRTSAGPTVERDDGRIFEVRTTPPAETFYLFTERAGGTAPTAGADPRSALDASSRYALRFHLDHPASLPVEGYLYQFGARKVAARQTLHVRPEWNTVHFEPAPGAVAFGLSLFFATDGLESAQRVTLRHTELRAWPALEACGR
jgi:hypothetical protein